MLYIRCMSIWKHSTNNLRPSLQTGLNGENKTCCLFNRHPSESNSEESFQDGRPEPEAEIDDAVSGELV